MKIYKQYSDKAIEIVSNNPYQLATDIYGIGFVTADAMVALRTAEGIARNLGIAPGAEYRYRAGIVHVLGEAAEDGHCFLPYGELVEKVVERLALADHQPSPTVLKNLIFQRDFFKNNQRWENQKAPVTRTHYGSKLLQPHSASGQYPPPRRQTHDWFRGSSCMGVMATP